MEENVQLSIQAALLKTDLGSLHGRSQNRNQRIQIKLKILNWKERIGKNTARKKDTAKL